MNTEERFAAAHAAANDGPGRDVQVHVPGSWGDEPEWVVWCGSVIARGATLDDALDALIAALRAQGGCWYCPENYRL